MSLPSALSGDPSPLSQCPYPAPIPQHRLLGSHPLGRLPSTHGPGKSLRPACYALSDRLIPLPVRGCERNRKGDLAALAVSIRGAKFKPGAWSGPKLRSGLAFYRVRNKRTRFRRGRGGDHNVARCSAYTAGRPNNAPHIFWGPGDLQIFRQWSAGLLMSHDRRKVLSETRQGDSTKSVVSRGKMAKRLGDVADDEPVELFSEN